MREWAKKKPLGDDIREIPEEFLKPFDWELEEQGQAGGDAQQDDPFAAFRVSGEPGPGADREAGAPAWVDSATGGDAQQDDPFAAFRVSGEPGPAADRQAGAAGDDDPLAGIFAPRDVTEASETPKEKRGLFGRLFGRKRHDGPGDEPAAPLAADWLFEPAEATPAEPLRAADAPGAWIRADGDNGAPEEAWGASAGPTFAEDRTVAEGFAAEVRAQDAPVTAGTFGSTRAEGRLPVEDEGVSFDRAEEPAEDEEWAPEPVPLFQAPPEPGPGAGPAAVIEPQAAPDDEEEWAPEPVLPFAAPQAAAGEVPAGEAAGETSSAQDGAAWEPESAELSPSAFGAAVQAAFWSAPAVDDATAEERPWWETPEAEETAEAAAGSEPVAVQPEATAAERPWWEAPEAEETSVAAVSAEPPAVQPEAPAEERPWWEAPEAEETAAAAVSAEPPAVQPEAPVAEERPWWEAPEAQETTAAAASAEPPAVQPEAPAEERPWWEAPEAEETAAAAMSSEPPAVQPEGTAAERPWWEAPEAQETTAAAASAEPPAVQPEATAAERPWWERPAGLEPPVAWTQAQPSAAQREVRDGGSDDMWVDIAETAELAAAGSGDSGELDLAASLEAQLGASLDEPAWTAPSPPAHEDDAFRSTEDEGDVILKAFEAHASTPDPDEDPAETAEREAETAAALAALLGEHATEIVEEAGEEPQERSFIRLGAWAPQRSLSTDDGWAPEEEVRQEIEARMGPFGFTGDPLAATPPWLTEAETADEERPARSGSDGKLKAWVREVVETVMLAALVFLSVRASFGNFKVDGNSMYPTLENGEFLIVNKLVYSEVDLEKLSNFLPFIDPGDDPTRYVFHGPQRGDIVVLRDPRDPSTDLIKRVIGLPGETVEIVNGKVYINDRLLEEPYITTPWNDTLPKILIPPDEYFVMGDNRNNSLDSRSAQVGLVSKDLIIGKAVLTYLPLNRFGLAPNGKGVLTEQKPVLTTKRIGEE
jgi:signal peptidase I